MQELTIFHHNFWSRNNHLHTLAATAESQFDQDAQGADGLFYKKFMESRSKEFEIYHQETWKRNFNLLKTGYLCIFKSVMGVQSNVESCK